MLVDPRRIRDRAVELNDEEAALAGALAVTWGVVDTTDAGDDEDPDPSERFPRLNVAYERLLGRSAAPVLSMVPVADSPSMPGVVARGIEPVHGDRALLAARLSELVAGGLLGDGVRRGGGVGVAVWPPSWPRRAWPCPSCPSAVGTGRRGRRGRPRPVASGAAHRRGAPRARRRGAGGQGGDPGRGGLHRAPPCPSSRPGAGPAHRRVLRRSRPRRLRGASPARGGPVRRDGDAHRQRRVPRLPAARVPRRRQALPALGPDRRARPPTAEANHRRSTASAAASGSARGPRRAPPCTRSPRSSSSCTGCACT